MYCRGCRYDLRHLPESRCPECGRPFDARDASTYVSQPSWSLRYAVVEGRRLFRLDWPRIGAGFLLTGAFTLYLFVINTTTLVICVSYPDYRRGNLETLLKNWERQRAAYLAPQTVYPPPAFGYVPPGFSVRLDAAALAKRRAWVRFAEKLEYNPWAPLGYCVSMALLTRRSWRRAFLCVSMVLLLCGLVFLFRWQVADIVWPPARNYVNDYFFVHDAEWLAVDGRDRIIVAYERRSLGGHDRVVGLLNGAVWQIPESEFLCLADEQHLDPSPP